MSAARLILEPGEVDEDSFFVEVYSILRDSLQPESKLSSEETASKIGRMMPERKLYSSDVAGLYSICFEIAEQIPYDHISMPKHVAILDLCINFHDNQNAKPDTAERYQILGEELRDTWNVVLPDEDPMRYLNFQGFIICLDEHLNTRRSVMPIFVLQDAFEMDLAGIKTPEGQKACIKAGLRYLILRGDAIYQEISDEGNQDKWRLWHEKVQQIASIEKPKRPRKSSWLSWLNRIPGNAAEIDTVDERGATYSADIIDCAHEALMAMEAIDPCKPLKAG